MNELDRMLNEQAIAEQRRSHALRGPLLKAAIRHRLSTWAARIARCFRPA
jgi:hypothetical protein